MNTEVHRFMLSFQRRHGHPPTLQQIADSVGGINYRSSARFAVRQLMDGGMVKVVPGKWARHARRYEALGERDQRTDYPEPGP